MLVFAIIAARRAHPDSKVATTTLSFLHEGKEGKDLMGGETATVTLCQINKKQLKVGCVEHPGAKMNAVEFFNAVQRHGGSRAVRTMSLGHSHATAYGSVLMHLRLTAVEQAGVASLCMSAIRSNLQLFVQVLIIVAGFGPRQRWKSNSSCIRPQPVGERREHEIDIIPTINQTIAQEQRLLTIPPVYEFTVTAFAKKNNSIIKRMYDFYSSTDLLRSFMRLIKNFWPDCCR